VRLRVRVRVRVRALDLRVAPAALGLVLGHERVLLYQLGVDRLG